MSLGGATMRLGEDLRKPTDDRLRMSAELGVESVVIGHPDRVTDRATGLYDPDLLEREQGRIRGMGLAVEGLRLTEPADAFLDHIGGSPEFPRRLERIRRNIEIASRAGISTLMYNFHFMAVARTGKRPGRGGARYPEFSAEVMDDESLGRHSVASMKPSLASRPVVGVTEEASWDAITAILAEMVPTAEAEGIRLACHPQDPPLPEDGSYRGIWHVLGTVDGLTALLEISSSPVHGLVFCQGTVAEMCDDPASEVIDAIRYFAATGRVFNVHFRNIQGRRGDFCEAYPDDGVVDMREALVAYHEAGYTGSLCPDHIPRSAVSGSEERQYAFCLGYTRGLLQGSLDPEPNENHEVWKGNSR